VGEANWVETRAWNQIGIHRGTLKEQLHKIWECRCSFSSAFHWGFWNFPKNCLAVTWDPPGDTYCRTQISGFLDDPPGGETLPAWRRELNFSVCCSLMFCVDLCSSDDSWLNTW